MVGVAGLEPATSRSQSAHSKPTELYPDNTRAIIQQNPYSFDFKSSKIPSNGSDS